MPNKTSCGGDVRDAAYMSDYNASYNLPHDASTFLLVVGVNHNATGMATYSNVVVEAAPANGGVFNFSCDALVGADSRRFGGTAQPFARRDTDKLFAVHVSRDCKALAATAGPMATFRCLQVDCQGVRHCDTLRVVTRAYLEVATTTGPKYSELVWPRVVEYKQH